MRASRSRERNGQDLQNRELRAEEAGPGLRTSIPGNTTNRPQTRVSSRQTIEGVAWPTGQARGASLGENSWDQHRASVDSTPTMMKTELSCRNPTPLYSGARIENSSDHAGGPRASPLAATGARTGATASRGIPRHTPRSRRLSGTKDSISQAITKMCAALTPASPHRESGRVCAWAFLTSAANEVSWSSAQRRFALNSDRVKSLARPIVLCGGGALLAGHDEGAAWERIASLIETAKMNRGEPYPWLKATLVAAGNSKTTPTFGFPGISSPVLLNAEVLHPHRLRWGGQPADTSRCRPVDVP